jgi:hypothetical protein
VETSPRINNLVVEDKMRQETTRVNLETAKLAHKRMVEAVDLRTLSIAQMAAQIVCDAGFQQEWGAAGAVKIAEEIMAEAEASAAKAKELQDVKDK